MRKVLILISFVLISSVCLAGQKALRLILSLTIDFGEVDTTNISILKNGQKWKTLKPSKKSASTAKDSIELDFQNKYLISFSKKGYISKSVLVDTHLPNGAGQIARLPISLTLFKDYNGYSVFALNQPNLLFDYDPTTNSFINDSIQYQKQYKIPTIIKALNAMDVATRKCKMANSILNNKELKAKYSGWQQDSIRNYCVYPNYQGYTISPQQWDSLRKANAENFLKRKFGTKFVNDNLKFSSFYRDGTEVACFETISTNNPEGRNTILVYFQEILYDPDKFGYNSV